MSGVAGTGGGGAGRPRVVAVIPAYNEEATLGEVIEALRKSPLVDRVVVISDGSTDGTARVAREHGAVCIELSENVGKGGAMKAGVDFAEADADVFLFLDADLIGLKPSHVRALLTPVLKGRAGMTVGVFVGGRWRTDLAQRIAPFLSGQRAVRREVLEAIPHLEATRYGVETALTRHLRGGGVRVEYVPLPRVTHRTKEEKLGLLRGFVERMRMYWDIVRCSGEDLAGGGRR